MTESKYETDYETTNYYYYVQCYDSVPTGEYTQEFAAASGRKRTVDVCLRIENSNDGQDPWICHVIKRVLRQIIIIDNFSQ